MRIEDILDELFNIVEDWSGTSGISDYEDEDSLQYYKRGHKRVLMSPDEYIKKAANTFRRGGSASSIKKIEKGRASHRDTIEDLKKKIADPNVKMYEPFLKYNQKDGNMDDEQEGLHRAVAAKELGHKTIPVHIIHPTKKRTPEERRKYQSEKIEARKKAKEYKAQERKNRAQNEGLNISEECFNDIVSMVEAMLESLNSQIDKKLEQGEIGLNKALELSDKVKSTMSDEKNRQEEFERQAKNPKSFENEMRSTQKSKAIGRAQRKGKIK